MYSFTIDSVTPAAFQDKKAEIIKDGLTITPITTTGQNIAEGYIEGNVMGFDIKLQYAFTGGSVEVSILHKPFIASDATVEEKTREWFK